MSSSTERIVQEREQISRISGGRLTSVQFILDYLNLGFDEKGVLTCLVWPDIVHGAKKTVFGDRDYRNEICALIEASVDNAEMNDDETILLRFDSGTVIEVPLRQRTDGGERAILTGPKNYLYVF